MTVRTDAPDDWAEAMRAAARLDEQPPPERHSTLEIQIVSGGDTRPGRRLLIVEYDVVDEGRLLAAIRASQRG